MPKKAIKKTEVAKKTTNLSTNANIEKALIENFISLQKVLTNLSIKFDGLSTKITKLLDLFEISAKALSEKDFKMGGTGDLSEKMDKLLDQNKTLAQGISLLHENGDEDDYDESETPEKRHESLKAKHLEPEKKTTPIPSPETTEKKNAKEDMKDYEKSISSKRE